MAYGPPGGRGGGWTEGSMACNPDPAYLWDDYAAVLPAWPHGTRHPDHQEEVGGMNRKQPGLQSRPCIPVG
jgi:hypothetical protein